jgi:hypothetical protein
MALPVLADQDAEADAGALVASVTKLVETNHLGFHVALGMSRRRGRRYRADDRNPPPLPTMISPS